MGLFDRFKSGSSQPKRVTEDQIREEQVPIEVKDWLAIKTEGIKLGESGKHKAAMKLYLDQIKADSDPERQSEIVYLMLNQAVSYIYGAGGAVGRMEGRIDNWRRYDEYEPGQPAKEEQHADRLEAGKQLDVAHFYFKYALKFEPHNDRAHYVNQAIKDVEAKFESVGGRYVSSPYE